MNEIVELTVEECLSLLRTRVAGRIAMTTPSGLGIFPVNYSIVDDRIIFRTLPYGVIANSVHGTEVAFQIDHTDEDQQRGWSVLAVGTCTRVEDPADVRRIKEEWDPEPWAAGQRNLYFWVDWRNLTGRQVGMPSRPPLTT